MLARYDTSLRTSYAQAKELALAQPVVPLATAGSLVTESRGRKRFVYRRRYGGGGERVSEYLGREGAPETVAVVVAAEAEIREAALLSRLSLDLRRVGFYGVEQATGRTVARLVNAGLFSGGAVLVGTHAFGALMNELGCRATAFPQTDDVDVARPTRLRMAAVPAGGLLAILRETGLPFHEVPELSPGAGATSWKARGSALKVDLVVPAKGVPYRAVAVPELRAHATGLPFLDFLVAEPIRSVLLSRDRIVPVTVPSAARYCIHKLAVHSLRSASEDSKRAKDLDQAATLAEAVEPADLAQAVDAAPRALRTKARTAARRVMERLESRADEAADVIRRLVG